MINRFTRPATTKTVPLLVACILRCNRQTSVVSRACRLSVRLQPTRHAVIGKVQSKWTKSIAPSASGYAHHHHPHNNIELFQVRTCLVVPKRETVSSIQLRRLPGGPWSSTLPHGGPNLSQISHWVIAPLLTPVTIALFVRDLCRLSPEREGLMCRGSCACMWGGDRVGVGGCRVSTSPTWGVAKEG